MTWGKVPRDCTFASRFDCPAPLAAARDLTGLRLFRQGRCSLPKKLRFYKHLLTQLDLLDTTGKSKVRTRVIFDSESGQRLDNFLIRELKGVPKSHIYRIIRDGQVRINGGRSRAAARLGTGDRVRIPPLRLADRDSAEATSSDRWFIPQILHEDNDLLIIDKPSGIAVHGGTGQKTSVIQQLRMISPDYLELIHRLDKETSGILMLAKTREALLAMHSQLQAPNSRQRMKKVYQALLCGRWRGKSRTVNRPLETVRPKIGEKRSQVSETGRFAQSIFSPIELFQNFSLLEIMLATGRLHQIRAHASAEGMPVAGDKIYGEKEQNKALRRIGLTRQFLHASGVSFRHPTTKKAISVQSPLPESLLSVLTQLREEA
ncbi:MAG TPA: RNA pseudouridine synthase [Gammaproteobacteria bacterium]|nr:RNA pseudouridine synthase [Gammaproteobacteria bacterium]